MDEQMPPIRGEIIVPDEMAAGIYANNFTGYYNATDFTVDFSVVLPWERREDEDGPLHSRALPGGCQDQTPSVADVPVDATPRISIVGV